MIEVIPYMTGSYSLERNSFVSGGEPIIFHCHHYNTFLQLTLEECQSYINVHDILIDSAHEIAFTQFRRYFREEDLSIDIRKEIVQKYYQDSGFGLIDLNQVNPKWGIVRTDSNHYGIGWLSKFGKRKKNESGVSFFTTGFLAGAIEAIYDLNMGDLISKQMKCITHDEPFSEFKIAVSHIQRKLEPSPKEGKFQTFEYKYPDLNEACDINYKGIIEALTNMPIVGNDRGLIEAFGVLLTRHYANYYGLISYRLLEAMRAKFGKEGVSIVKDLLVEAGHVCAFNTFGGIMLSAEWSALIKPMIKNREGWVHGIVACVNALGWGKWVIKELIPKQKLVIKIISGYESNNYTSSFGSSNIPVSFLATGGVAGIMNLIYNGDITTYPELTEEYYEQIFKSPKRFKCVQTKCRAMGDEFDEFVAERA